MKIVEITNPQRKENDPRVNNMTSVQEESRIVPKKNIGMATTFKDLLLGTNGNTWFDMSDEEDILERG